MTYKVLDVRQGTDFNGEINYTMTILGDFKEYQNIVPSTQKVDLTPEQFTKYKSEVGKDLPLSLVIPVSKYPLSLSDKK